MEMESRWSVSAVGRIDGAVGLMGVRLSGGAAVALGRIAPGAQGDNGFTTDIETLIVDENRLRTDWRYSMEVGVRLLVARKVETVGAGADSSILENWYYPLAFYHGAVKYRPGQLWQFDQGQRSRLLLLARRVRKCRLDRHRGVSVPGMRLQHRRATVRDSRQPAVVLRAACQGGPARARGGPRRVGERTLVEPVFCFWDQATFSPDGSVTLGPQGAGVEGCLRQRVTRTGVRIHVAPF